MAADGLDARLRLAMFAHLDRLSAAHPDGIPSNVINTFAFEGGRCAWWFSPASGSPRTCPPR